MLNQRCVCVWIVPRSLPSVLNSLSVAWLQEIVLHSSLSAVARKDDALTLYKSFQRFNDEKQLGEMEMTL